MYYHVVFLHSILSVIISQTPNLIELLPCLPPFRGRSLPTQPVSQGIHTSQHSCTNGYPRKWNSPSACLAVICSCYMLSDTRNGTFCLHMVEGYYLLQWEVQSLQEWVPQCVSALKLLLIVLLHKQSWPLTKCLFFAVFLSIKLFLPIDGGWLS